MAGSKRERELARAKYERQQARRTAEAAKRRRRTQIVTSVVAAVVVIGGIAVLTKVLGGGDSTTASTSPSGQPSSSPSSSVSASVSPSAAVIPTDGSNATCTYTTSGTAAGSRPVTPPPASAPTRPVTTTATLVINGKPVTVSLLTSKAPCTVNSFVHLAGQKYFDKTPCHRLTKGSLAVLQCGDPGGTGSGGPGYRFPDENLTGATYKAGTVAMANAGPNTNGSQFFIVYADSSLPPSYTPFGTVTGGLDVVTAIAGAGVAGGGQDGKPANPVTIDSVTTGG